MPQVTRTETRKRGLIGKVFLALFWIFNAFMAFATFAGISANVDTAQTLATEAEQAGYAVGTALGISLIAGLWMAGAVILGLLVFMTRGKKIITETTTEA